MKLTEYNEAESFDDGDILIKDGDLGTMKIPIEKVVEYLSETINPTVIFEDPEGYATNITEKMNEAEAIFAAAMAAEEHRYEKTYSVTTPTSQFTFNPTGYTYGSGDRFEVYVNGLKLDSSAYSNNDNLITIDAGVSGSGAPDVVEIICYVQDTATVDTTLSLPGVPADAKKTGDEITELKEDLSDLEDYVTDATTEHKTATGASVTISDAVSGNLISAINTLPYQAGGYSKATIKRTGKNLFGAKLSTFTSGNWKLEYDSATGVFTRTCLYTGNLTSKNIITGDLMSNAIGTIWIPAGTYIFNFAVVTNNTKYDVLLTYIRLTIEDEDGTQTTILPVTPFTVTKKFKVVEIASTANLTYNSSEGYKYISFKFQIEKGNHTTDFEPYYADIAEMDLTDLGATFYGGTVDFTNGVVTSEYNSSGSEITPVEYTTEAEQLSVLNGYNYIYSYDGTITIIYGANLQSLIAGVYTELSDRIDTLEAVPDYWLEDIEEAIDDVALLQTYDKGVTFGFITDIHYETNWRQSPRLIEYLATNARLQMWVNGGDTVNGDFSDGTTCMKDLFHAIGKYNGNYRFYSLIGNHDDNHVGNDSGTTLTSEELRNLIMPQYDNITYGDGNYYYFDFCGTRFVCLDTGGYGSTDATQIAWASTVIRNANMPVVICMHIIKVNYTDATPCPFFNDLMTALSSATNVQLIIGGHTHHDDYFISDIGCPAIMLNTDSKANDDGTSRVAGTTTEQCLSVIVADYDAGVIHVVRVGAVGSSFNVSYLIT